MIDDLFSRIFHELAIIKDILLAKNNDIKEGKLDQGQPMWFNIQELSKYLPDKPAVQTLYKKVANKQIPFHKDKVSGRLRFLKAEIDEFLMEGKVKSNKEIEEEAKSYLVKKKCKVKNEKEQI